MALCVEADEWEQVGDLAPQPLDKPLAVGFGVAARHQAPYPGQEVAHLEVSRGLVVMRVESPLCVPGIDDYPL